MMRASLDNYLAKLHDREVEWILALQALKIPGLQTLCVLVQLALHENTFVVVTPMISLLWNHETPMAFLAMATFHDLSTGILKWTLQSPRPYQHYRRKLHSKPLQLIPTAFEKDFSTPSGHTELATAVVFMLVTKYGYDPLITTPAIILPVALSRVVCSMHYFTDVTLSIPVGIIISLVFYGWRIDDFWRASPLNGLITSAFFGGCLFMIYQETKSDARAAKSRQLELVASGFVRANGQKDVKSQTKLTSPILQNKTIRVNGKHLKVPKKVTAPPKIVSKAPLLRLMSPTRYITMLAFHIGLTVSRYLKTANPSSSPDAAPSCVPLLATHFMVGMAYIILHIFLLEIVSKQWPTGSRGLGTRYLLEFILCLSMAFWSGWGVTHAKAWIDTILKHRLCT